MWKNVFFSINYSEKINYFNQVLLHSFTPRALDLYYLGLQNLQRLEIFIAKITSYEPGADKNLMTDRQKASQATGRNRNQDSAP